MHRYLGRYHSKSGEDTVNNNNSLQQEFDTSSAILVQSSPTPTFTHSNTHKTRTTMFKRFINNNFAIFATGSMAASMVAGWVCLSYIQDPNNQKQNPYLLQQNQQPATILDDKSNNRVRSREEYRLQAMVENALNSTWQQNLDNAFQAQERFMLPGRHEGQAQPKFVDQIDRRAEELLKKQEKRHARKLLRQQQQLEQQEAKLYAEPKEEKQQETTRFWK